MPAFKTAIAKHSIKIAGHRTSVSMESEFWAELQRMAQDAGKPLSELVTDIDQQRQDGSLSGALRLAVLADLRARAFTEMSGNDHARLLLAEAVI